MIRGVDAQVMTQRAAEYSKDVSAMLRRDEVANEFASRMNRLNVQQEMQAVSQLEKAEQQRVMEEKALAKGLLEEAQKKAAYSIKMLLTQALPEDTELTVG